jgi:hypothetical protein
MKQEWRKLEKALYLPKMEPMLLHIPKMQYLTIMGEGNPNSELFSEKVGALYAMAYGIRMLNKSDSIPEGYIEYTVYPLEGVWDLSQEGREAYQMKVQLIELKDQLIYTLMIRQPAFVTSDLVESIREKVLKKNDNPYIKDVKLEIIEEGESVQMTHIGSYDDEPASFERMEAFATSIGKKRKSKLHKEIYVTDPSKVPVEKLKTTLRIWVE